MIKAIFIDMDNTLIDNQYLYDEATAALCGYLSAFKVDFDEARETELRIDKEHFKTYGYSRERMPATFAAVVKHYVPDATPDMLDTARSFAERIFSTVARVKPGTPEAIDIMTAELPVFIVTAGPGDVQEGRVSHLPFKDKLAGVFCVEKKDPKTYLEICEDLGLKPEEVVMIGDSLKSDVIAPVNAGLMAVWVEAYNSVFEAASDVPKERAYKFNSLLEAAQHIAKHGTPAPEKKPTITAVKPPKYGT